MRNPCLQITFDLLSLFVLTILMPTSAGEEMKPGATQPDLPTNAGDVTLARLDKLRNSTGSLSTSDIRRNMQRTMQVCSPPPPLLPHHLGQI